MSPPCPPPIVAQLGFGVDMLIVRNQPFEHHAQAMAKLIAACQSGGNSEWLRLAHYAIFQSAAKVMRRFTSTGSFELLITLLPPSEVPLDFPGFSRTDMIRLRGMLLKDDELAEDFPLLGAFVDPARPFPPDASSLPLLQEFHRYFICLLRESKRQVEVLDSLRSRNSCPPSALLGRQVEWAHGICEDLHYFVWHSKFFDWYILKYQRLAIADLHANSSNDNDNEGDDQASSQANQDSNQGYDDEREEGDFPTDYESAPNHDDSTDPAQPEKQKSPAYQVISWLRLVTSTVQHTHRFRRTTPGPRIQLDFQVITYPQSDKMMKPWMETIAELGGGGERQIEILNVLSKNSEFTSFITKKRLMKFSGRAHCEAVLGCLHSLAKRGENLNWVRINLTFLSV